MISFAFLIYNSSLNRSGVLDLGFMPANILCIYIFVRDLTTFFHDRRWFHNTILHKIYLIRKLPL